MLIPHIFVNDMPIPAIEIEHSLVGEKSADTVTFYTTHPPSLHSELTLIYFPCRLTGSVPYLYNMFLPCNEGIKKEKPFTSFGSITTLGEENGEFMVSQNVSNKILGTGYVYPKKFTIISMASPTYFHKDNATSNGVSIFKSAAETLQVQIGTQALSASHSALANLCLCITTFHVGDTQTNVKVYIMPVNSNNLILLINGVINAVPTTDAVNIVWNTGNDLCYYYAIIEDLLTEHQIRTVALVLSSMYKRPLIQGWKYKVSEITREQYQYKVTATSLLGYVASKEVIKEYSNKSTGEIINDLFTEYASELTPVYVNVNSNANTYTNLSLSTKLIDALQLLAKNAKWIFFTAGKYVIFTDPLQFKLSGAVFKRKHMQIINNQHLYSQMNKVIVYNTTPADQFTESFVGNGSQTRFSLRYKPTNLVVKVNNVQAVLGIDYDVDSKDIIFKSAPASGANINVTYDAYFSTIVSATGLTGANERKVYTSGLMDYSTMKRYALSLLEQENKNVYEVRGINQCRLIPNLIIRYRDDLVQEIDYHYYMIFRNQIYDQISQSSTFLNFKVEKGEQLPSYDFIKTCFTPVSDAETASHALKQGIRQRYIFYIKLVRRSSATIQANKRICSFGDLILETNATPDIQLRVLSADGSTFRTIVLPSTADSVTSIMVRRYGLLYRVYQNSKLIAEFVHTSPNNNVFTSVQYGLSGSSLSNVFIDTLIIAKNYDTIANILLGNSYYKTLTHVDEYTVKEVKISSRGHLSALLFASSYDSLMIEKEYYEKIHTLEEISLAKQNFASVIERQETLLFFDVPIKLTLMPVGLEDISMTDSIQMTVYVISYWDGSTTKWNDDDIWS